LLLPIALLPGLAEAAGAAEGTHLGVPDGIWKLANFVLFFGLLAYLAARPAREAFRSRREGIVNRAKEARQKREEAARTEETIREKIAALEKEVAEFDRRTREDGERERRELEQRAETEAVRILDQARHEVRNQGEAARRDLAAFAGELAVDLAARQLEGSLDDAARKRFFDQAVDEIGSTGATDA